LATSKNIRIAILILIGCLCISLISSCSGRTDEFVSLSLKAVSSQKPKTSPYAPIGTDGEYDIISENGSYQLILNAANCNLAIKNRQNGTIFKTFLDETDLSDISAADVRNQYMSHLQIQFYDEREKEYIMDSHSEAVEKNQWELFSVPDGLKIVYTFGESGETGIFPEAITKKTMTQLIEKMTPEDKEEILSYYDITSLQNYDESAAKDIVAAYPLIEKEDLYLPRNISKRIKDRLIPVFTSAGFTKSKVIEEYKTIGFKTDVKTGPNFIIPVLFILTDDGFSVQVPMDEVTYDKKLYRLTHIKLLPNFGASSKDETGYMFIPDGSGALVDFETSHENGIELPVYGMDEAVKDQDDNSSKQVVLPVFGISKNQSGFIALIEDGAGLATIYCNPHNNVYGRNTVGTGFSVIERKEYNALNKTISNKIVRYSKKHYNGLLKINYYLLDKENSGYVGMAQKLQSVIFKGRKRVDGQTLPFYLDTYGVVKRKEHILGYPVEVSRSLTTFEEAGDMLKELSKEGVGSIHLRFKNWQTDENENKIPSKRSASYVLGGTKALKGLIQTAAEQNIKIFPDADILRNKKPSIFDRADYARSVSGTPMDKEGLISPKILDKGANSFLSSMADYGLKTASLSSVGSIVYSDFNEKNTYLRSDTQELFDSLGSQISEQYELMVEQGNYYMLKYASHILDIPTSSGGHKIESSSVPFLQILLHGYVNYAGYALNLSGDMNTEFLKSIEYGGGVHYCLNSAEPKMLKYTEYSHLYSTEYAHWSVHAINNYQRANQALKDTVGELIQDHYSPQENLYITQFGNGITVAVNYNKTAVSYKNVLIEAMDFSVLPVR